MRLPTRSSLRSIFFPWTVSEEMVEAYSRSDLTFVVRHLRIVSSSLISASWRVSNASCDAWPCRLVEKPILPSDRELSQRCGTSQISGSYSLRRDILDVTSASVVIFNLDRPGALNGNDVSRIVT